MHIVLDKNLARKDCKQTLYLAHLKLKRRVFFVATATGATTFYLPSGRGFGFDFVKLIEELT